MVAYAVSAIAGNTPRLKALGAALLFVRFPATVDVPERATVPLTTQGEVHWVTHTVPPVRFTFRLVPVEVRAVPPANSSEFVPMTLPDGAVPNAVGEPRATEFHSVMLVLAFAGGTVVTVPLTTHGDVH